MKSNHTTDALEHRLQAKSPKPARAVHADFTKRIMNYIVHHPRKQTWYQRFFKPVPAAWEHLHTMPRLAAAALIVGVPMGIGGAAYATYEWVKPSATITHITPSNDAGNRQFSVTALCGEFMAGTLQYEISPHSHITDADAGKAFSNTCAYDAVQKFISSTWISDNDQEQFSKKKVGDIVTIYQHSNMFVGDSTANPVFGLTTGTVTQISANSVTIAAPIYTMESVLSEPRTLAAPTTITRTLPLQQSYQVWQDGKQISQSAIQVGDVVQLVGREQHKVQYYDDIKQNALGEQIGFDVVAVVKVDLDLPYVMYQPFGNPVFANALASLSPCYGNDDYLCASLANNVFGVIYDASGQVDGQADNSKYLRSDFQDSAKVQPRAVSGRVTAISPTVITLQTRGKVDTITVHLPYDVIGAYNTRVANNTANGPMLRTDLPLVIGDMVTINYIQSTSQDRTAIQSSDIAQISIMEYVSDNTAYKY